MTRKETALDALNKKIPKLEEKINRRMHTSSFLRN